MPSKHVGRFHDGVTARPHDVAVELTDEALVAREAGGTVRAVWPWPRIRRLSGGDGLRLALGNASPRLTITDPGLITAVRARLPSRWPERRRLALGVVGGLGIAVAVIYAVVAVLPGAVVRHLPGSWSRALGELALRSLAGDARTCDDAGRQALEALTARLRSVAREQRADAPEVRLVVLDMPLPNAFALPGGIVVVTRGLIGQAEAPEAVAGVIAHELGHAIEHHPDEGTVLALGLQGLLALIGAGGSGTDQVLGLGAELALLRYSREQEREADTWAIRLLTATGASGAPTATLLQRLDRFVGEVPPILSSHLGVDERSERLRTVEGTAVLMTEQAWADVRRVCRAGRPSPRP